MIKKQIILYLFVIFAGLIQNTDLLVISGTKINVSLAVLLGLIFFIPKFLDYLILVLLLVLLLIFKSPMDRELIIFFIIVLIAYFIGRRLKLAVKGMP